MYFLPEQVAEYDRKKMIGGGRAVQQSLFVSDESSAIEWLRNLLRDKPQSFQDINPKFMQEISGWNKHEKGLELSTLLAQNFLCYDGKGDVPSQIHSHLSTCYKELQNLQKNDPALITKAKDRWYVPNPNKAGDLEKLRKKALLKEFEKYKQAKQKLKLFRMEDDAPEGSGTKVTCDVLAVNNDTLFPLQGALEYEIHQTLFIEPNTLVVEGPSDLIYLKVMSDVLARKGKTALSEKWTITPSGGAGKIPMFVSLIGSQKKMNIATLMDIDPETDQIAKQLITQKLLKKKNLITCSPVE